MTNLSEKEIPSNIKNDLSQLIKSVFVDRNPNAGIHEKMSGEFSGYLKPHLKGKKFGILSIADKHDEEGKFVLRQLHFGENYDNGEFCFYLPSSWNVKKVEGPNIVIADGDIVRLSVMMIPLNNFTNSYEKWLSNNKICAYYYNPLFYPDFNQLVSVILPEGENSGWVWSFFDDGRWLVIIKGDYKSFNELCDILTVMVFSSPWKFWIKARQKKLERQKVSLPEELQESDRFSVVKNQERLQNILESAVSDAGMFLGISRSSGNIMLSFSRVQLIDEDLKRWTPPSSKYALVFRKPEFANLFLLRKDISLDMLEADCEPLRITHDWFTISADREMVQKVMKSGATMVPISENEFVIDSFLKLPFRLLFLAGSPYWIEDEIFPSVGVLIGANDLWLLNSKGKSIMPGNIEAMHSKWWSYYKDYWKAKDSEQPYAEDPLCESMVPAGDE